jgi:alanyl-tRNA synthetase
VVEPGRLRFDFAHYTALDPDEMAEIEKLMNDRIFINTAVQTDIMDIDQALKTGAMALFGEKYGDSVRVVNIPGFSRELCGGTHVKRTGDIGICKIVYEGSISAGVRRIEALTGEGALRKFQQATSSLNRISSLMRTSEAEIVDHVERFIFQQKNLEKQLEQLKQRIAQAQAGAVEHSARVVKGVKVVSAQVHGLDRLQLRALADSLKHKLKSGIIVLATAQDSNVAIITAVTKDLTAKVHAGKLAGAVAQAVGGKGGGRPDMAEAGGSSPAALPGALEGVYTAVEGML